MTQADIGRSRLNALGLLRRSDADPASAVSNVAAMQAQDYHGLLWSVGSRVSGATKATVEAALASARVVRTWLFRGTLHLAAAEDLRWMLATVAPRLISGTRSRREALGLGDEDFVRSRKALVASLGGGRSLDREGVLAVLEAAGLSTANGRGYHLIFRASIDGVICQGGPNGTEQNFVLLDDWVRDDRKIERDEAYAELARRYFSSHGPATIRDFIGWSGLTAREARSGMAAVADLLEKVVIEGKEYWTAKGSAAIDRAGAAKILLLAGFDEFILGYKDRDAILEQTFAQRICPGNNGVFAPTVVSDGRVVGTWKRTIKKGTVVIETFPFTAFSASERDGIADAAERYASFLGLAPELRI
jgi:hypothetical protein